MERTEIRIAANAVDIARIERVQVDWTEHDLIHKESKAERGKQIGRIDERLKVLEQTKIKRDSQIEALQNKTIALDQSITSTNNTLRDLSNNLNDVMADSRVSQEILQRLEASQLRALRQ